MDDRAQRRAASYDVIVDRYAERNANPSTEFTDFRDLFRTAVAPQGLVLDLGCGPGRDAKALKEANLKVIAIDLSWGMVKHARSERIITIHGDLRRPPLAPAAFDGLWSAASLLHVPVEQTISTLTNWRALLKPNGILGLSTSLTNHGHAEAQGWEHGWELTPYAPSTQPGTADIQRWFVHRRRDDLIEQLSTAGFTVTQTAEVVSHRRWLQVLARAT